jgi:1-acyl-sn-glycerol-3-phosphate acyltransferase
VVVTNTENNRIYGNLKRLRRTRVSLEVGKPFRLTALPEQTSPDERRQAIKDGTDLIMLKLAEMLPPEYRGVYDG